MKKKPAAAKADHFAKPGDTVQLNSGGPVMTISSFGDSCVYCLWMDKDGHVHRDEFPAACLSEATAAASQ